MNTGFLHALDALPASVTKNLESNPPPVQPSSSTIVPQSETGVEVHDKPIVKTARKKRVPKNVVPGVTPPPDPERWLKKSERSTTFTQSGKRRKAGGGGATQGAVETSSPAPSQGKTAGGAKGKKKK